MHEVAVIGGGIKGASLAALLAGSPSVHVTMFEPFAGVRGATATNHGRLHSGAAGWRSESAELMRRRRQGSEAWRAVGLAAEQHPAVYAFDDEADLEMCLARCAAAEILGRRLARPAVGSWLPGSTPTVEISEYFFDPAGVTQQLRAHAVEGGATWRQAPVRAVHRVGDGVTLACDEGTWRFETVIACLGRWASTVPCDWRDSPFVDLEWFEWPIMAFPTAEVPALDRVIARHRSNGRHCTVIPHGDVVTLDLLTTPQPTAVTTTLPAAPGNTPIDVNHPDFTECLSVFPALEGVRTLRAFTGVQGRIRGAAPGSAGQVIRDADVDDYLVAFGGQASTALLDALDVMATMWREGRIDADPQDSLARLRMESWQQPRNSIMAWSLA